MRKKDLLLQNIQLFDRISVAETQLAELKKEIAERDKIITAQKNEIELMKAAAFKAEKSDTAVVKVGDVSGTVNVTPEIDYGAAVIGKIVLEATRCCNIITADDNSDMAKELINLILGRTEVAKSDILRVVSSQDAEELKKQKIDRCYEDAVDYFNSIMAQKQ